MQALSTHIRRFCVIKRIFCLESNVQLFSSRLVKKTEATIRSMPKKDKQTDKLRHIKHREKRGGTDPAPSVIDLHVVANGAKFNPSACMLLTDHLRYLFNCGEGTQRIATEHKLKISRCEHVFITHKSWKNIGGLLGFALTIQGMNLPTVTLHGPPGIEKILTQGKGFSHLVSGDFNVVKRELEEGSFTDSTMTVEYVPLTKGFSENEGIGDTDKPVAKKLKADNGVRDVTVAYLCKPKQPKPKIDLEKVSELDISRKDFKKFGQVTSGFEITLEDGRVIKPEQVLMDRNPVFPFLVIEIPDENYLDSLLTNKLLQDHQVQNDDTSDKIIHLVVHMTPAEIMATEKYQIWMSRFRSSTTHITINEESNGPGLQGVFRIQAMLNMLHGGIFPLLPAQCKAAEDCIQDSDKNCVSGDTKIQAETNLKYRVLPKKGFNREQCFQLDNEAFIKEARTQPDLDENLKNLKENLSAVQSDELSVRPYPEIVFLGTGSAMPSKVRNVSSTLLRLSESQYMLLDCGEDTIGQMHRFYGDKLPDVLEKLSAIFVSHMHADHHMGLFGIVHARSQVFRSQHKEVPPLLVLAPIQINRWLQSYSENVENILPWVRHVALQSDDTEIWGNVLSLLQLKEFNPVGVMHCKNAYGVALKHKDDWKLVYSGDTMPCPALVTAGKDCDVLIHEATMEDDLADEALTKTHSTTSQAINIGIEMNAKFILLNHFSQRYAKIPMFNENFSNRVGIAFDNMRVCLKDLQLLPMFLPTLKAMFADDYMEMELKNEKLLIKRQREGIKSISKENF